MLGPVTVTLRASACVTSHPNVRLFSLKEEERLTEVITGRLTCTTLTYTFSQASHLARTGQGDSPYQRHPLLSSSLGL